MRRLLGTLVLLAGVAGCGIAAPDEPDHTLPTVNAPSTVSTSAAVESPTAAAPPFVRPSVAPTALVARFAYDAKAPLNVTKTFTATENTTVAPSTPSAGAGGPPIAAKVVTVAGSKGRHPAVVLAHGGAPDPDAFTAEAKLLAGHGVISIMPDIP